VATWLTFTAVGALIPFVANFGSLGFTGPLELGYAFRIVVISALVRVGNNCCRKVVRSF